ncbi:MAG: type II toxin-antitoxin system HipA family toxin [Coriobacteriales bacterium]|nr:type II toxin-antitoxin system HipA family toxin [Coriobacteriales bacterium]
MEKRAIQVFVGEKAILVGTAFFNGVGPRLRTTFTYASSWLGSRHSFALAPTAPLSSSSLQFVGLPGFLSDAAPDRWGRRLIFRGAQGEADRSHTAMRSLDDVDYLLGVDDWARMGALRFSRDEGQTFIGKGTDIPKIVRLPQLLTAARSVDAGTDEWRQLKSLLDVGSSSLGGARPKATVQDGRTLWLAKFPSVRDEWDVMTWEAWALIMARRAGLKTPDIRVERVGEVSILLSRRFDRAEQERIPYLSALSALGLQDGADADYLDLADVLLDSSDRPHGDIRELFARMVLSVALHNTDDHLRNHGFLQSGKGWRLSPVFDVNPCPFENERRALSVMGTCSMGEEAQGLAAFAEAVGIDKSEARGIVQRVLDAFAYWQAVARRVGCPQKEVNLFAPVIEKCSAKLTEQF